MISVFCIFVLGYPLFSSVGDEFQSPVLIMLLFDHGPNSACICSRVYHGSTMKFRASWFSENSDRGIAISVSILSSGFSDALFVCFWWLVTLERLLAICIRTFLILQVLNLKPPTVNIKDQNFLIVIRISCLLSKENANQNILIAIRISWLLSKKMQFFLIVIRIVWLWSEFSDCDQNLSKKCKSEYSDCDQNFLIVIQKMQIRIFWLLSKKCKSEFSDCDQDFLIVIRIFWLWSEVSDCDQKFLIVIRIFWLWSEFSDCEQKFLMVIRIFWLWSNWEKNKCLLRNKQNRKTENNKQRLKTILCFDRPPRHINPRIHWGILLSVISSGVASGVLSGIKYGVLSGKSFAIFTWQKFWRSVWHTFWSDWWKVRLLKICLVWVSCRDHRLFCLFAGFHPSNGRAIWHIAYIFMFGTGLEPGQAAGTLDMRSCAPSISTWHFGTLLRPPGNLKWGPNAYPTKKPSPTKLHRVNCHHPLCSLDLLLKAGKIPVFASSQTPRHWLNSTGVLLKSGRILWNNKVLKLQIRWFFQPMISI